MKNIKIAVSALTNEIMAGTLGKDSSNVLVGETVDVTEQVERAYLLHLYEDAERSGENTTILENEQFKMEFTRKDMEG